VVFSSESHDLNEREQMKNLPRKNSNGAAPKVKTRGGLTDEVLNSKKLIILLNRQVFKWLYLAASFIFGRKNYYPHKGGKTQIKPRSPVKIYTN